MKTKRAQILMRVLTILLLISMILSFVVMLRPI